MRKIQIPDEGAESLFGTYDENLKQLESQFGVRIRTAGKELIVEGEPGDVARAERVVEQLATLMRGGYRLAKGDVKTAAQLVSQDEHVELSDYFLRSATKSAGKRQVVPKSVTQKRYLDAIEQHDIVFGIGPAGTGKTYLAMAQAVSFLLAKRVSRIILARPAVVTGDVTQIDLPVGRTSGLVEAMKVVGNVEGISFVHFDDKDVVRHTLVQQIVKAYEAFGGSR